MSFYTTADNVACSLENISLKSEFLRYNSVVISIRVVHLRKKSEKMVVVCQRIKTIIGITDNYNFTYGHNAAF